MKSSTSPENPSEVQIATNASQSLQQLDQLFVFLLKNILVPGVELCIIWMAPSNSLGGVGASPHLEQLKLAPRGRGGKHSKHSRATYRKNMPSHCCSLLCRFYLFRPRPSTCTVHPSSVYSCFPPASFAASATIVLASCGSFLPLLHPFFFRASFSQLAPFLVLLVLRICLFRFSTAGSATLITVVYVQRPLMSLYYLSSTLEPLPSTDFILAPHGALQPPSPPPCWWPASCCGVATLCLPPTPSPSPPILLVSGAAPLMVAPHRSRPVD